MSDVAVFLGLLFIAAGVLGKMAWDVYVKPFVAGFYWGVMAR